MKNCLVIACIVFSLPLLSGEGLFQCLREGDLLLDARYRLESVEQDGFGDDALASTLRTRFGYRTAAYHGFTFLVEFENIVVIGEDTYNDTSNGELSRPVVADREDTELNRAHASYAFSANHRLIIGRQRLILDNARFIGNVGWRQNEQTYDAFLWQHNKKTWLDLKAGYIHNVNRIFGEHHPSRGDIRMESFILHGDLSLGKAGTLALFAHLLEDEDNPISSHQNIGFACHGQWPPETKPAVTYRVSLVEQQDYQEGGNFIDASYRQGSVGFKAGDFKGSVNLEILGGDGVYGFATPLATGHAFNGWADLFLATPTDGLRDAFISLGWGQKNWQARLDFHDFEADSGSRAFGDELDGVLTTHWGKRHSASLKYADYRAETHAVDARKIWLSYQFKY